MNNNTFAIESFISFCDDMMVAEESRKETSAAWNNMIKSYKAEWKASRQCIKEKDWDKAIAHLNNAIKLCNDLKRELPNHPDIPISENILAIFKPSQWYKSKQTQHIESAGNVTTFTTYHDYYSDSEKRKHFKNLQYALNVKIKDCEVQIGYLKQRKAGNGRIVSSLANTQRY